MEENLDINNEVNKEIPEKTTNSSSKEIKEASSEKDTNKVISNGNSQSNSAPKVDIKNGFFNL